ncbi:hypothetical protein [Leifsonia aquatica]|uniref:hypothetical protein n=1 Tax=Leifsonia aquatica TaxID=144185 RepID=UPI0038266506
MVVVTHHVMVEAVLHVVTAQQEIALTLGRQKAVLRPSGHSRRPDSGHIVHRKKRHQGIRVTQKRRASYSRRAVSQPGREAFTGRT